MEEKTKDLASQVIWFADDLRERLEKVTEKIDKIPVVGTDAEAALKDARDQLAAAFTLVDHIKNAARTAVIEIDGAYE